MSRADAPVLSSPEQSLGRRLFWDFLRTFVLIAFKYLYRYHVSGKEFVPRTGPVLFISNHQSHFDPPLVGLACYPRRFAALARLSLFNSSFFSWLIRMLGAIPLKRDATDTMAMRAAINELKAGYSVLLFPEGTRTRDGSVGHFKPGVMAIIRRTKVPVVPVAIEGAFDTWPIGRSMPHIRGRTMVRISRPIPAAVLLDRSADDAMTLLRDRIEDVRLEMARSLRLQSGKKTVFGQFALTHVDDAQADETVGR